MSPLNLRIKELRTAKGWSQRELSRRAGVRQATVSHLESGKVKTVDLSVLERLAKALQVDAGYLIVKKRK
jgi:transcriptional regulator with XRE-family HTH domain